MEMWFVVLFLILDSLQTQKNDQSKKYGKVGEFSTWPATRFLNYIGASPVPGFQLKYIYFLNKRAKERLTVPILPFSKIDEMGAGMYKGKRVSLQDRKNAAVAHTGEHLTTSQEGAFDSTLPLNTP
jgi:hypothetical protein